jgi:ATP-dependent helicase YprA (DUF1998 family)
LIGVSVALGRGDMIPSHSSVQQGYVLVLNSEDEFPFLAEFDAETGKWKTIWEKEKKPVDIVLATNMLSVGVDVDRLGLMVVNGQPKGAAEYIQATSRVGRAHPGLVATVLTWARPRDLSHYETFEHYHSTFYQHVEAQSVTPFSPRALDRGLTGATMSLMRLSHNDFAPNEGAAKMDTREGLCRCRRRK